MKIEFIAHATFLITLNDGRKLILDPYQAHTFSGRFDYPPFKTSADFALITHEHIDHNFLGDLLNIPVVVRNAWHDEHLDISSQFVWHDKYGGTKFGGGVNMKIIEADGIRLCHMGDCGEILTDAQIEQMGKMDVLIIPVGGFYTLDGHESASLASRINARTTIPCHYATKLCTLPITGPEEFLGHFDRITKLDSNCIQAEDLCDGIVMMPGKFA